MYMYGDVTRPRNGSNKMFIYVYHLFACSKKKFSYIRKSRGEIHYYTKNNCNMSTDREKGRRNASSGDRHQVKRIKEEKLAKPGEQEGMPQHQHCPLAKRHGDRKSK
jgi:hypothetical protein